MIIQNATLIDQYSDYVTDLRIQNGVIDKLGKSIVPLEGEKVLDATGLYLMPKVMDIGVNFSDGSLKGVPRVAQKAYKGGVGTVINSSKTTPPINNEAALESLQLKSSFEKIEFCSLVNAKGEQGLSNLAILLNKGGVGIEIDSDYDMNLIARTFEYAKLKNVPIVCNANSGSLQGNGIIHEGKVAAKLGLPGISTLCESAEVVKIAHMADFYGVKLLFLNLSTKEGIDLSQGCFVSTSIHHLLFDDSACENYNTTAKIHPPLREKLLDKLEQIDILTSMHAKTSVSNKDFAFAEASYGVDSLEEFLRVSYTHLVKSGVIGMPALVDKLCYKPASVFNIECSIEEGAPAEMILFDPTAAAVVNNPNSLYEGQTLYGRVIHLPAD